MFEILLLCTGNATRSIMAEALFNRDGAGRVRACSAGANPAGRIHPRTLALLHRHGLDCRGYRSKSWQEFAADGARAMDLIISLCPGVAADAGPSWPGSPMLAHWPIEDPATAPPDQIGIAFQYTYHRLERLITAFLAMPFETMPTENLDKALRALSPIK